jgi:AhpD family alkylhydroperoxidase
MLRCGSTRCKTKELLGLVASAVCCDDCVKYHLKPATRKGYQRRNDGSHGNSDLVGGTIEFLIYEEPMILEALERKQQPNKLLRS